MRDWSHNRITFHNVAKQQRVFFLYCRSILMLSGLNRISAWKKFLLNNTSTTTTKTFPIQLSPSRPALLKFNKGLTPAEIGYIVAGVLGLVRIATGCGIVYYRKKRNGRDRRSADNMGGVEGGTFDRAGEHVQVDPETHNTPLTVRSHTLGREKKK